jgi:HAD superfamily hydrolase (TIGR01549 family)
MPIGGKKKAQQSVLASEKLNVIFDFDGTIANTLPIIIDLVEKWSVSDIHLTIELIEELRGLPAQQALKRVGIPLRKVPGLITRGRKELLEKLADAKPFKGMLEVIEELAQSCNLYVMSSNSDVNINQFLDTYNLAKYFRAVHGNVSVFGKTKVLKKIIKQEGLDKDHCIYVGDETRDIEAAHKLKLKVISVTWGYNNKQILSTFRPDYLVDKPRDLLTILR